VRLYRMSAACHERTFSHMRVGERRRDRHLLNFMRPIASDLPTKGWTWRSPQGRW
jgi:hypothetical protein